jgi:hypothetical protein
VNFIQPFDSVASNHSILTITTLGNTFKGLNFQLDIEILLDFGSFLHFNAPQVQRYFS